MHSKLAAAALLGALATIPGAAPAQTQGSTATPAVRTDGNPTAGTPVPGSNSFTEGQARGRIEDAGFRDVSDLTKDDQGIWRGRATRGGAQTSVALDYQGNVFSDAAAAGSAAGAASPATPRDGAPGNPPGTAAGRATDRATDRALGTNTTGANPGGDRPDGAPGNPPGTAAGRAPDRALGTNTTGSSPGGDRPDGVPGNPPSTAAGRAVDRAQGQAPQPDGTPSNPAGTAAGRTVDRALGTNATGANPGASSPAR